MPVQKIARTVISLARFSFSQNDIVVHHVKTEQGTVYVVTLNSNGTSGCYGMDGEECKGHKHAGHCYHVDGARRIENERTARLTPVPAKRDISEAPIHHNQGFSMMR